MVKNITIFTTNTCAYCAMVKKYLSQGVALCRGHLRERLGLAADEADK